VGTYVAANRECKELLACISNAEAKIHELVAQKKEAVKDEEEAGDTAGDDADGPVNLSEILKNVSSEDLLDLLKDRFQRATKDFDLTQSVDVPDVPVAKRQKPGKVQVPKRPAVGALTKRFLEANGIKWEAPELILVTGAADTC
jgi:hypothetical protein